MKHTNSFGSFARMFLVAWATLGAPSCLGAMDPEDEQIDQSAEEARAQPCTITYYQTAAKTTVVGRCFLPCLGTMTCTGQRTSYSTTLCSGRC